MNATKNKQLVQKYFDVLMGKVSDTPFESFFTPDVVWHIPKSNPLITPNPREGLAQVMELLASGVGVYQPDSIQVTLHRLVADEQHVAAQFSLQAVLANGNDYDNDYFFLFSIRDGQIDGVWEYMDTLYQSQRGSFDTPS